MKTLMKPLSPFLSKFPQCVNTAKCGPVSNLLWTPPAPSTHAHTPCLRAQYFTISPEPSWQPEPPCGPYLRSSTVRLHQGLVQALAHVANQGGCRLNYDSASCGQNEQKHMCRRCWFNENIKHISTLTVKRLHRHLHVVGMRNPLAVCEGNQRI